MSKWRFAAELGSASGHGILAAIVFAYLVLGVLYATLTPAWQVPDEPAHYNYVRYLVEERRLPVLSMGDYDQAYLSEITTRRFDPGLSIDPIRYEYHQPPLYYLLAAPVYIVFGGALVPLRLLSVLLGAGLLVVAYQVGKAMFPDCTWPALGATAFIAFIPQHIAMTAAVENDTLAELILGLVLLGLVRWLKSDAGPTVQLVKTGLYIGLGLLTKVGIYITVPLAVVAMWLKFRRAMSSEVRHPAARQTLVTATALLLPALLLGLPWLIRNASVYGALDIMGLGRHDQVVVGQLRTGEWIAEHGWTSLPGTFVRTTFRSFWAQFGWMAVPIDPQIYIALRLLCVLALLGFALRLIDKWEARQRPSSATLLLACSALLTLATYVGYNLSFYQAQGRYLFPALIPLGLGWAFGLRETLRRKNAALVGIALALATVLGGIKWLTRAGSSKWPVLTTGLCTAFIGGRWSLPGRIGDWLGDWLFVVPYLLLVILCAVSPFWFIIPYLRP